MILINFSHSLSNVQLKQIEELSQKTVTNILELDANFDDQKPFLKQATTILENLTEILKKESISEKSIADAGGIVLNVPSYNYITALVLAGFEGLFGYLPTIVRNRRKLDSLPTEYEVAELIDLKSFRDELRILRFSSNNSD